MAHEQIEQMMQDADKLLDDCKLPEAVEIYNKVLEQDSKQDKALAMLGAIHGEMGDIPKAVETLEKALEINDSNADAWLTLGLIQQHKGDDNQALISLRNAAKNAPDDPEIYVILGKHLLETNQHDEALASFVEAVRYDPQHVQAVFTAAALFQKTEDYENAASGYQAVLDLKPDHQKAHQRLPNMLLKLDRYEDAEKAALAAIKIFPEDPWLHARLATIYSANINIPAAVESINNARELEPGNDEIEQRYADILVKRGEHEEALIILEPLMNRDNPVFAAVMSFSQFASELGKKDEAKTFLTKLKESDELTNPQHDDVTRTLMYLDIK